jgi:hypothetical protein
MQETGHGGRNGRPAHATLFCWPDSWDNSACAKQLWEMINSGECCQYAISGYFDDQPVSYSCLLRSILCDNCEQNQDIPLPTDSHVQNLRDFTAEMLRRQGHSESNWIETLYRLAIFYSKGSCILCMLIGSPCAAHTTKECAMFHFHLHSSLKAALRVGGALILPSDLSTCFHTMLRDTECNELP